ncbi:hypothetical protein EVA_03784 [gut metagenome]|uniref:Uncharacterized protein n=1 Tax=gut metagenome TaxID=749906 RepID=J9GL42_9ZZZZ
MPVGQRIRINVQVIPEHRIVITYKISIRTAVRQL